MLNIIVRSRKDADAIENVLERYYSQWDIEVKTLKGARKLDEINMYLSTIIRDDRYNLLLLGREEEDLLPEITSNRPVNFEAYIVPRRKIRNTRLDHLAWIIDVGRSLFRLKASWRDEAGAYVLDWDGFPLEDYRIDPAYDIFFGFGEGFSKYISKILGGKICGAPLIVRKHGGLHDIYCGAKKVAFLNIPDNRFRPSGKILDEPRVNVNQEKIIELNKEKIEVHEKISLSLIKKFKNWADKVVVPWSGGKDSTAVLLLAMKVFPIEKIVPIYVDTGTEFPQTKRYVEEIAEKYGLDVIIGYAGVDRGLLVEKLPFPTHDNRWCTGRKVEVIEKITSEFKDSNILVLRGDRDSESRNRSLRPPIHVESGSKIVLSPIKFWSTAHVQLYLLMNGVRLNPLYQLGFYRVGCYMCPALRSWELFLMLEDQELRKELEKLIIFRKFLEYRRSISSEKRVTE